MIDNDDHPAAVDGDSFRAIALKIGRSEGEFDEALELIEKLVDRTQRELGPEHRTSWAVLDALARVLNKQGKYSEAKTLAEQALESQRQTLGQEHREALASLATLAESLEGLGDSQFALGLREELLATHRRVFGADHPDATRAMSRLGRSLTLSENQGTRALQLAEAAAEALPDDPEIWQSLGFVYAGLGNWEKSRVALERALQLGYRGDLIPAAMRQRIDNPKIEPTYPLANQPVDKT